MIIGYQLIDQNNNVVKQWDNTTIIPNPIVLTNGDIVYCANVGQSFNGLTLTAMEANVAPVPAPTAPTFTDLQNRLLINIRTCCDSITRQIAPTQTKQFAYQNAAMILNGNQGEVPTTGPFVNTFMALANSWNMDSNTFAAMVEGMQQTSLTLATLELNMENQITTANSADALTTILNDFQASFNSIVDGINASAPMPVTAPPAIIITGLN